MSLFDIYKATKVGISDSLFASIAGQKMGTPVNLFDGITEKGIYDATDGTPQSSAYYVRNVNPIFCEPNTEYHYSNEGSGSFGAILYYDENDVYLGYNEPDTTTNNFTSLADAHYMNFYANRNQTNMSITKVK